MPPRLRSEPERSALCARTSNAPTPARPLEATESLQDNLPEKFRSLSADSSIAGAARSKSNLRRIPGKFVPERFRRRLQCLPWVASGPLLREEKAPQSGVFPGIQPASRRADGEKAGSGREPIRIFARPN